MHTHLATLMRGVLMAGVAAAALSSPAHAQPSPEALDSLFLDLTQLQDANIGIARQMSEIQRRAAMVLEAVLAADQVTDPAQREVVEAFISNARTLASVVLAPVATQEVAAGAVFSLLLEENMKLVARAEPLFGQNRDLAQAMEQYAVMQVQTQDLGLALHNGWNRYGQALAAAEASALLPPGAFDASAKSWSINIPELALANIESGLPVETVEASGEEDRLAPDGAELALEAEAAEAPVAEAVERLAEATPEPEPTAEPAPAPDTEVAALTTESVAASPDADRLPAGEALALADPAAAAQSAGWMVMIGDNARAVAIAPNSNAATAGRIRGLQIGCHPNGTLRYIFETDDDIPEYLVFANQAQSAKIRAESNTISGGQAIQMSDVLRLAFEWATANATPDSNLMVAAADSPDDVATFPVSGYLEARGRVLDGCVPWEDESRPATDAMPVTGSAQVDGEAPLELTTEQGPAVDSVAPIPHPRPASRMPVDLMTAG